MPTLLIVDDEKMVRTCIARAMERRGWAVITAASGATALRLMKRCSIDVVLTDLLMPGMNGIELLGKLQDAAPHVPVMFMSGHPYQVQRSPIPLPCWAPPPEVIAKPFTLAAIADRITKLAESVATRA